MGSQPHLARTRLRHLVVGEEGKFKVGGDGSVHVN